MKPWKPKTCDVFDAAFHEDILALLQEFFQGKDLSFDAFKQCWKSRKFSATHHTYPKSCDRSLFTQNLFALTLKFFHYTPSMIKELRIFPDEITGLNELLVQSIFHIGVLYTLYCLFYTSPICNTSIPFIRVDMNTAVLIGIAVQKWQHLTEFSADARNCFARLMTSNVLHLSSYNQPAGIDAAAAASTAISNEAKLEEITSLMKDALDQVQQLKDIGGAAICAQLLQLGLSYETYQPVAAAPIIAQEMLLHRIAEVREASARSSSLFIRRTQRRPIDVQRTEPPLPRRPILSTRARADDLTMRFNSVHLATDEVTADANAQTQSAQVLLPGLYRVAEDAPTNAIVPPITSEEPVIQEQVAPETQAQGSDEQLLAMLEGEISAAQEIVSQPKTKQKGRTRVTNRTKKSRSKDTAAAAAVVPQNQDEALLHLLEAEITDTDALLADVRRARTVPSSRRRQRPSAITESHDEQLISMLENEINEANQLVSNQPTTTAIPRQQQPSAKRTRALHAIQQLLAANHETPLQTNEASTVGNNDPALSRTQQRQGPKNRAKRAVRSLIERSNREEERAIQAAEPVTTNDDQLLSMLESEIAEAEQMVHHNTSKR